MRVTSIGGGPAGLYASILLKKADPSSAVTVYERNAPDDTFGFGVVFSAATLAELEDADAPTFAALTKACARWDPVDIQTGRVTVRGRGNQFAAISRKVLLGILQRRCAELGVDVRYKTESEDPTEHLHADLVIAADGANSRTRARFAENFKPRLERGGGKFIWLGTTRRLDAFTFFFVENEHGCFQAHAYPYDERMATFIVECDEASWRAAGLDRHERDPLPPGESDLAAVTYCRELFAHVLGGHGLVVNNSKWLDWVTVRNRSWRAGNVVLLGDAAHTAHFSIGSGTKLAMEDAIALARAIDRTSSLDDALADYEAERRGVVERLQAAAQQSMEWFMRYPRYRHFAPPQFAYSLLTRSGRVTYENLRTRDPGFIDAFQRWYAQDSRLAAGGAPPLIAPPPAFVPLRLGPVTLPNRLVLSPTPPYTALDGVPAPEHLAALRAAGSAGAALLRLELVAVSPHARVTSGCVGLHEAAQEEAIGRLCANVHGAGPTRVAVQLVHAGRRGATRPRTLGSDRPLPNQAWGLVSASPLPYTPHSQTPAELDREAMAEVVDAFSAAARRAAAAGVDVLDLHLGGGYLLGSFISPLTNRRDDEYGGALDRRMRFPLKVVRAVRDVWPPDRILATTVTASDLQPGGLPEDEAVTVVRMLADAGVGLFEALSGHTTQAFRPDYAQPAYNAPWSDLVRNRARVPVITAGAIRSPWAADGVLAAGKADLCVLEQAAGQELDWLHHQGTGRR